MYKKMLRKALKDVKDNKEIGQRRFFPTNNICTLLAFIYPKEPALYNCLKNQHILISNMPTNGFLHAYPYISLFKDLQTHLK